MTSSGVPLGNVPVVEGAETSAAADTVRTEVMIPSGQEGTGISPEARQRLEERIAASGGDQTEVERELYGRLQEMDSRQVPEEEGPERTQFQAERALLVAEMSYLEKRASSRAASEKRS